MNNAAMRHATTLLAILLLFPALAEARPVPRLTVLVVVDQLSGELIDRHGASLKGGLGQLLSEGVRFDDARYAATPTVTSSGHAALATGAYGSVNGINGNDWFDRRQNKVVYCVEDPAHQVLGRPPRAKDGTSPLHLRAPTLADTFRSAHPQARVVVVAGKDRSAILLGGRAPNAAIWFDRPSGRFTTSTFYALRPPAWLTPINEQLDGLRQKGFVWSRTDASKGIQDAVAHEGTGHGGGATFPHRLPPKLEPQLFGERLLRRPEADRLTLALAKSAVVAEGLGRDEVPDLLMVSLSAHDYINHDFGPDSAEAVEALAAIDRELGALLAFVDQSVGRENVVVALSSDHGGATAVALARSRGLGGGRIELKKCEALIEDAVSRRFGRKEWLQAFTESGIYLLDDGQAEPDVVRSEAAKALTGCPGIAQVFRRGAMSEWSATAEGRAAARGYNAKDGADLLAALEPYWIWDEDAASHGSLHAYDARVPLIVRAPGVQPSVVTRRVEPIDLPVTLARLAGLSPPGASSGELLGEVFAAPAGSLNSTAPRAK